MEPQHGIVVVIPFYNGADYIERALKSVFVQTVQSQDIVVVNDGSRAEERAALGELQKRYSFRIIDKANGGQGSARNAGVAASTASLVAFLDQDDFYLPHHHEALLARIPPDDSRVGFVYGDVIWADVDGKVQHTNMLRLLPGPHPKTGDVRHIIGRDLYILPSATLILRSAFEAIGGFDEQFTGYEDDDLFGRFFRAGYTNYFVEDSVTSWCRHTGSTSYSIKMARSRYRYFKKLLAMYPDEPAFGLYFFREALLPRFERKIFHDVEHAARVGDPNLPELRAILGEFLSVVFADKTVSRQQKIKLGLEGFLLNALPSSLVVALKDAASLPLLRDAARWLHRR